jgi:hypothetical protein
MEGKTMNFLFQTTASMKHYNNKKWWIDSGIVREIRVDADSLRAALEKYREIVQNRDYIKISNNALKCAEPMYLDTENGDAVQVGYVITGKTEFDDDRRGWITQYIDLWVSAYIVSNPFEMEAGS